MNLNRRLLMLCTCLVVVAGLLAAKIAGRPLLFTTVIEGPSMEPTFEHGDVLLCARLPLRIGQIVVATEDDQCHNNLIVKRIRIRKVDGYGVDVLRMTADNEPSAIYWAKVAEVKGVVLARIW